MENDKPYVYGLGPVPEGAKPNGQGGWYYPETCTGIGKPIDFGAIADKLLKDNPAAKIFYDWEKLKQDENNNT